MVFDPKMRRRMETSFPSKLIEFSQFGKPLVVWVRSIARRWNGRGETMRCLVWWTRILLLCSKHSNTLRPRLWSADAMPMQRQKQRVRNLTVPGLMIHFVSC